MGQKIYLKELKWGCDGMVDMSGLSPDDQNWL